MLLAIDAGNTETVVGLYEHARPGTADGADGHRRAPWPDARRSLHHWRLSTVSARTPDEHAVVLTQLLDLEGLDIAVGRERDRDQLLGPRDHVPAATDGLALVPGVPLRRARPRDRIRHAHPLRRTRRRSARTASRTPSAPSTCTGGRCVVVDLGTATTFDAISADGEYLGGAIAPGVAISLEALYGQAAALRAVELVEPRAVIGKSTEESIQSGVLYGYAAQSTGCARGSQRCSGSPRSSRPAGSRR